MEIEYPSKVEMSSDEYHAHEAAGSTGLKTVLFKSVAHYLYEKKNPKEKTKALDFGTVFHAAVLEPKAYKEKIIVQPDFSGTGSRALKDKWLTENHGKMIVKPDEMDDIKGMLGSISEHKIAGRLVASGISEQSFFWIDPLTGVPCKARLDHLRTGDITVDIKTTTDASLDEFQKTIVKFSYHLSGAHYLDGGTQVLGTKLKIFIIIAIEKFPPYALQVFQLNEAALEKGLELRNRALLKLKDYKDTGIIKYYSDDIVSAGLSPWGWTQ